MAKKHKRNTFNSLVKKIGSARKETGTTKFLEHESGKNPKLFKLKYLLFCIVLICLTTFAYFFCRLHFDEWSSFTAQGGIFGNVLKKGEYIIFGTDLSKLFIVSTKNSRNVKTIDLNTGTVFPEIIEGKYAYVISGNTFWKVDIQKSTSVWEFTNESLSAIEKSEIKGKYLYLSSRDGSFFVLDKNTGKVIWKFEKKLEGDLSSKIIDGRIFYAPDFWIDKKFIYLAGRDGNIYSLDGKNGKVVWEYNLEDTVIANITVYKNQIFVFTISGKIVSFDKSSGKILWKINDINRALCGGIYKSGLVQLTSSSQIIYRDVKNGDVIWESEVFGGGINCPETYTSDGVFSQNNGHVFRVDMASGKTKWIKYGLGESSLPPIQYIVNLFDRNYLYADLDGNLWSIGLDSKTNWVFNTHQPIRTQPLISGANIFIGTSGAEIYKINKTNGKVFRFPSFLKFTTTLDSKTVGENEIIEISLNSKSDFINPWSEGLLSATLTSPSGKEIKIDGFYYDNKTWKIRFNPPEKGTWIYNLIWNDHGAIYNKRGNFLSDTDTSHSFLRISRKNPKRLTLDGNTIFNGVGIQSSMLDYNNTGTPLDDWSIGDEDLLQEIPSSSVSSQLDIEGKTITLDRFLKEYGPSGAGFNIYRYGDSNVNDSLYRSLENPTVYLINNGKIVDTLLESLKSNGIHVWYSFFHFVVPYADMSNPSDLSTMSLYIRHIIARYGAYVDIWELVNEYEASEDVKTFLINEIKKYDFEDRLITTSPEDISTPGIDIISPHWYETEKLSDSDKKTVDYIKSFSNQNKPVIFGEQGNGTTNWDSTSADRMRIRLWSAYFNNGMLIFWSSSSERGIKQDLPYFANIYLGSVERFYVNTLQRFTQSFDLDSTAASLNLDKYGVRGYSLKTNENFVGYFVNYKNIGKSVQFATTLSLPTEGKIEWYSPKTGETLGLDVCKQTDCYIESPLFDMDIAVKLLSLN